MKSAMRSTSVVLIGSVLVCMGMLTGCGASLSSGSGSGSGGSSTAPLASGGATSVYVSQQPSSGSGAGSLLQFSATTGGSVAPTTSLTTPSATLSYTLATDTSGRIYVGTLSPTSEVLVYAAGSTGSASASRTILSGTSGFIDPGAMVVDSASQLYVLDPTGSISVFSSTANNTAVPTRRIQGSLTQLATAAAPSNISVDASGNIYVSLGAIGGSGSTWTILEFSSTATGNVAPSRVITATSPTSLTNVYLSTLDANGNFYVVSEQTAGITITEFASNGTTTATPVKTIVGSATNLGVPLAFRVDGAGNLYVLSGGASGVSVEGFGATGTGNLVPAFQLTSTSLTSTNAGLALK